MANNSLQLSFGYKNSEQKRSYTFSDIPDSVVSGMKEKIIGINDSLAASTDGGLASFFVDDNNNNLQAIEEAKLVTITETPLDLGGNS